MPLPDNYFQGTSKPHLVTDEELDEMVNGVNSNERILTNVTSGHNHDGSNSRKVKQVACINLSKICVGGALNRVAFNIDFITPEAGGVSIFMNVQKTLGFTVNDQNNPTQSSMANLGWSNHTSLETNAGSSHTHTVSKSNISHTHTINAHSHNTAQHRHQIRLGTNAGDFIVYFDEQAGYNNSYLTKGVGVVKTAYTDQVVSPDRVVTLPENESVVTTMNPGEPASDFSTGGESAHIHTIDDLTHSIWDSGHTHALNHSHSLTHVQVPSGALPTPTFTLDPDTTPHSLPYNPTGSSPVEASWFTSGVHYIGVDVADSCEVSISIWIRGYI